MQVRVGSEQLGAASLKMKEDGGTLLEPHSPVGERTLPFAVVSALLRPFLPYSAPTLVGGTGMAPGRADETQKHSPITWATLNIC